MNQNVHVACKQGDMCKGENVCRGRCEDDTLGSEEIFLTW